MPTRSSGSVKLFYPPYSREDLLAELRQGLQSLRSELPVTRAVLFGSWATGRATAFSDVDLLVVYTGPSREDAYTIVRRCLRLRGLEPHVYSEGEARQIEPVLNRMTARGVELL